ncbi:MULTISPECIES: hypothetical protein [Paenibacillus]|uniref:hypothetical protein n=1 Tax=Paenibacillus TaxID=44249 RepID=UPI00203A92EF|nr:hypothetical protein [Paenibacillus camelliae]MCM3633698.1 hypothetical protein [Paenibacillus camelliae]
MKQRVKFYYRLFMKQPLWFKVLIPLTFIASLLFSSSLFSYNSNYDSLAKLSAALFFLVFGLKLRRNVKVSAVFFVLGIVCLALSWSSFDSSII